MFKALVVSLLFFSPLQAKTNDANTQFITLSDQFIEEYYRYHPNRATRAGLHQYDHQMQNCTKEAFSLRVKSLRSYEKLFSKINPKDLSPANRIDWKLLVSQIKAEELDLAELRSWETDPDNYSVDINEAVYLLLSRDFAPLEDRVRSMIEREKTALKVFECAKQNLKNPPLIYTKIALEQIPGMIRFFEKDIPLALKEVKDTKLMEEFQKANQDLIAGFKNYEAFLKTEVLPKSKGDFRIGKKQFLKKLKYEEMVEIPLEELEKIGMKNLRANQEHFKKVAAQIDPTRPTSEILAEMEKDHPAADKLLDAVRDGLGDIRKFIVKKDIITIPSERDPIVQETPPFKRATTFASMFTPGPFEKVGKEAYYNVTLPETDWPASKTEEYLRGYSYPVIASTSIHEALPGHYTQFLWFQNAPTKIRKIFGCKSNKEGWAHYTEQMMLDEGYAEGNPKFRLGQLQDALLRNARFIVGIRLHTGKMTFEEGVDFFVKEGYQSRANGERETKRGTADPTYLVYTLGKLQILQLREDYRRLKGAQFTLKGFHDEFVKQGFPPIELVREAMLGDKANSTR